MGVVNLGQVAASIKSVTIESLPEGATPTVKNTGTKINAEFAFGFPPYLTRATAQEMLDTQVDQATTTIENTLSTKLNEALEKKLNETLEKTLNDVIEKTNTIIINLLKNGYIQWPGMPTPDSLFNFPGYRWTEVNYNGCFFRANGYGALSFNGGEQGDAIRNIEGYFSGSEIFHRYDSCSGAFSVYNLESPCAVGNYDASGSGKVSFDASRVVPVSYENRPRNMTIIIWKLEKI